MSKIRISLSRRGVLSASQPVARYRGAPRVHAHLQTSVALGEITHAEVSNLMSALASSVQGRLAGASERKVAA